MHSQKMISKLHRNSSGRPIDQKPLNTPTTFSLSILVCCFREREEDLEIAEEYSRRKQGWRQLRSSASLHSSWDSTILPPPSPSLNFINKVGEQLVWLNATQAVCTIL